MKKLLLIPLLFLSLVSLSQTGQAGYKLFQVYDSLTHQPLGLDSARSLYFKNGTFSRGGTLNVPDTISYPTLFLSPDSLVINAANLTTTNTQRIIMRNITAATSPVPTQNSPALTFYSNTFSGGTSVINGISMYQRGNNNQSELVINEAGGTTPRIQFVVAGGAGSMTATGTVTTPTLNATSVTATNTTRMEIQSKSVSGSASVNLTTIGNAASFTNTMTAGSFINTRINQTYNQTSGTASNWDLVVDRTETALGSGTQGLFALRVAGTDYFSVDNKGKELSRGTITAGGTTGAQTINKPCGSVNFAAAAQTLVVTNSLITTSSLIFLSIMTDDATAKSAVISALSAGSCTIKLNQAATAETKVAFRIVDVQ